MKLDEFAFFNQQLAAMLRDGIPLESALGQLCASMRRGDLRDELEKLRADLANGVPLDQALASRKLPSFYVQMIQVGVKSNDLPGVLTLVADYYHEHSLIWTKLKGLLVYPAIVLVVSFVLSIFLSAICLTLYPSFDSLNDLGFDYHALWWWWSTGYPIGMWIPTVLVGMLLLAVLLIVSVRSWRIAVLWRIPGFRDAELSRVASSIALMLKSGCDLQDALSLTQRLEDGAPIAYEIAQWRTRLAAGRLKFADIAGHSRIVPPVFVWLVSNANEDLAAGFKRAAELYNSRAKHQTEVMLYAALPVSVLFLGALIMAQVYSFLVVILRMFLPWVTVL
jgi:type II secretory pathway component PulF